MGTINKISMSLAVVAMIAVSQSAWAGDEERRQAHRIINRLTGTVAPNATIDAMETLLENDPLCTPTEQLGCGKEAAEYAVDPANTPAARSFYNVTLKNFAAPWTNEEQTVFTPLNDYSATVIGTVRDGHDFREILYADRLYVGNNSPAYNNSNNAHYEVLEARDPGETNPAISGDLSNDNVLLETTQTAVRPGVAPAGIMTSRAGAMAFFSDGTNRAMFRFTLMNHLCTDLEPLKDNTRTPDHVRRDISRSPGGDSRIFLNGCVGCHAGMDGMAGAYAYYEWVYTNDKTDGHLEYQNTANTAKFHDLGPSIGVSRKHNINGTNFEYGYITTDDSWINYWRNGPNSILGNRPGDSGIGWLHPADGTDGISIDDPEKNNSVGNGARSLGIELANSRAFAQCQVDKVFKAVCLRDPNVFAADRDARDAFVDNFVTPNTAINPNPTTGNADGPYDLLEVFTDVAAYCKGS